MSVQEAIQALRAANWAPGVSTAEHPHRAQIKAAFAVLREHKVSLESLGLVYVPPPDPEEEKPEADAPKKRARKSKAE